MVVTVTLSLLMMRIVKFVDRGDPGATLSGISIWLWSERFCASQIHVVTA